ncbi:MAG: AAA family ATPase [Bacteroidota bacterium]
MKAPIYVKSLKLTNVRTFKEVELNLENEDGTIPQWTLIIGENGIGKSTLLQCIAWMKPVPYSDINKKDYNNKIQPYITDEENETFLRLVRKTKTKPELSAQIDAIFIANKKLNSKVLKENICNTSIKITLNSAGKLETVKHETNKPEQIFYKRMPIIYAYSASRRLGKLNMNDSELEDTLPQFIAERTVLFDAEDILHTSNYAALGAKGQEKKKSKEYLDKVKLMLASVLPNIEKPEHITIITPKLLSEYEKKGNVLLTTKHGLKIPFKNASLGYRTVISWTVDLAWRLFQEYPTSKDPLKEAAIVLIDEVDLHLHPKWQREIMKNLSTHFPNVQFIATAHSPLMVQPEFDIEFDNKLITIKPNYAVVKDDDDGGLIVLNDPHGIDGWRADQILTSEDYFNLKSTRGIKYDELMDERKKLLAKKRLLNRDRVRLAIITKQMSELPSGETAEEIKNRELIAKLASKIIDNKL